MTKDYLGFTFRWTSYPNNLHHLFKSMQERSLSQRAMAGELNGIGVPAPTGGAWMQNQVRRVLARLAQLPVKIHGREDLVRTIAERHARRQSASDSAHRRQAPAPRNAIRIC